MEGNENTLGMVIARLFAVYTYKYNISVCKIVLNGILNVVYEDRTEQFPLSDELGSGLLFFFAV